MDDSITNATAKIDERRNELVKEGFSNSIALGKACRELSYNTDILETVAEEHSIEVGTLRSYISKSRDREEQHIRKFLTGIGGYRTILSSTKLPTHDEWVFLVTGLDEDEDEYIGTSAVWEVRISVGGPSGEPTPTIDLRTERYTSLDALAKERYINRNAGSEYLSRWYSLLIDAGYDSEKLTAPGKKLPDSHPDSENHVQYQHRSLERSGTDRRPRR